MRCSSRDAFRPPEKVARADLQYERVCVLFNVAAALSYAGAAQKRGDEEAIRRACQLFQQAAHAVESVQGLLADGGGGAGSGPTADLSAEALGAWRGPMLAQAQQCFYEKAAREKIKPAVRAPRNSVRAILVAQFSEPLPLSTRWWPRSPRRRQSTTARRRRR